MSAPLTILIEDYEEKHVPAALPVLNMTLIGHQLFLQIDKVDETFDTTTLNRVTSISVDVDVLASALRALLIANKRARDWRPA